MEDQTLKLCRLGKAFLPPLELGLQRGIVTYLAPDSEAPLPDDIWGFEGSR